jgi:cathepsin L
MKLELTLLLIAALAASTYFYLPKAGKSEAEIEFAKFKEVFDRSYSKSEETYRFTIFEQNFAKINKHNADNTQTYKLGITQFADMTQEEFAAKMLTLNKLPQPLKPSVFLANTYEPVANGVDWRTSGAVTPIKNQGQCGSCWSFSTTGVLESVYKVKKGSLPNYSEQQLVDCCGKKGFQCQGCNGAWPEWALNYVNSAGIVSESSYPYKGVEGACQVTSGTKILNPSKPWTMLAAGDANALKSAVNASPVSICVDAANWSLYKSGVFSNCKAAQSALDHAVLLVGYEDSGNWIVKNSWGTGWGEQGYIRLAPGGTCGLALHAVIPNLA